MFVCLHMYHGQILQDLDPISWSHVSHVVEVGWIGDQFVPHLGISQHLSGITDTGSARQRQQRGFSSLQG